MRLSWLLVCALVATAAIAGGCQPAEYRLVLIYPDQAAYDRARRVELIIGQQTSCASLQAASGDRRLEFDAHGELPSLGRIGFGRASFWARVRDGDCALLLEGCSETELAAERGNTVRIPLIAASGNRCVDGQRCYSGQCLADDAAIADAGADAQVDAHIDAHLDTADSAADASSDRLAIDAATVDSALPDRASAPDTSAGDWWNGGWSRRRKLVFDNRGQAETLVDFPILLRLTSSSIDYSANQAAGQDLRFVDADGSSVLAHEIEHWHAWGETLIWVKVPAIEASSNLDSIWMYYGNNEAPDGQQPAAVWTHDFAAVYHLDNFDDSTSSAFDATDVGTSQEAGAIGWGRWFDGSGSWIHLPDDQPYIRGVSGWTLSAWLRADRHLAPRTCLGLTVHDPAPPTSTSRAALAADDGMLFTLARSSDTEAASYLYSSAPVLQIARWYHIVGVTDYSSGIMSLYQDGQFVAARAGAFAQNVAPDTNSSNGAIGSEDDGSGEYFAGIIDEVRVVRSARSAAWIRAEHLAETDALVSFGSEETP